MRIAHLMLILAGCVTGPGPDATPVGAAPPWSPDLPDRELVNECDPVIRPASAISAYDFGETDPHQEVYGDRAPDPFHVHLGWPSNDPSTSIAMLWRTDPTTLASALELTDPDGNTVVHEGASWRYGAQTPGEYRIHEVRLCSGLAPGTTYRYRVGGDGHWSPEYTFTTPLPPGTFDTYRIAVLGDSRGAYEDFGEILSRADAHEPDFFVFSGDLIDAGPWQSQWDAWFEATGDLLARKVLVPVHGNHESLAVHYFAQFALPNNEEWFSIRYGDLQFVGLNDTTRGLEQLDDQAVWQEEVFSSWDAGWRMAAHHKAAYSTCTTHRSTLPVRDAWAPVWDAHGVDLVVAGHNHTYERSAPIRGDAVAAAGEGTLYVVSGGAGAPLYTGVERDWFSAAWEPTLHYLIVDFGPDGIVGTAYKPMGDVIDTWTIPR